MTSSSISFVQKKNPAPKRFRLAVFRRRTPTVSLLAILFPYHVTEILLLVPDVKVRRRRLIADDKAAVVVVLVVMEDVDVVSALVEVAVVVLAMLL